MPRLLKDETVQRLTTCQRSISQAFALMSIPKPLEYEQSPTDGAIEIGLIGIAADLAISACLYEVFGRSGIIRKETGFYLTAQEALKSFRDLLHSTIPRISALTSGVPRPTDHIGQLEIACSGFSVIFTARAAAVHAGVGATFDVVYSAGKTVADFLLLLSKSPKWKPYLRYAPAVPDQPKEKILILEELKSMLAKGKKTEAASALTGIFIILPELTSVEPDWIKSLERVQVTPRSRDISFLLKSLQNAKVGNLHKVGKGASGIATKIDPTNPNALPIYISGMKKKFDQISDSWNAYIGTANGQLDNHVLSIPPIAAIYEFAAVGIDNLGLPPEDISQGISAHSIWPFVAGALDYSGTKGPCFFAVRQLKEGEFGQLKALLNSAAQLSNKIDASIREYLPLLDATSANKPVSSSSSLAIAFSNAVSIREQKRAILQESLEGRERKAQGKDKQSFNLLIEEVKTNDSLTSPLTLVANGTINLREDMFPVLRDLIDASTEPDELATLVDLFSKSNLKPIFTNLRKAIQQIDYAYYGPQIET